MYAERHEDRPVGYNPAFVRKVQEKRREQERLEQLRKSQLELEARQEAERKRAEEIRLRLEQEKATRELLAKYRQVQVDQTASLQFTSAKTIIAMVAAETGVSVQEMLGPSRNKEIVRARHKAMRAVADAKPEMSLPQMGRVFKRDHTTLLAALKKTRKPGQPR